MPVDFRIIADRGLVVVLMSGHVTIDETNLATAAYTTHPDYCAGQKQLIDLRNVTSYEKDYGRFIVMQASKAGRFTSSGTQTMVVYITPTPVSRELGMLYLRSWDDVEAVVPMRQDDESQALAVLGQPERTISELLARDCQNN